ncbi:hypothetical protein RN629_11870 [Sphingomonadaceae bacterium jetA1]|uniref:hypothetical protein n=1 Tax=Facivitalis istanbulensis TaxID=3075838 RepID=UPI00348DE8F0
MLSASPLPANGMVVPERRCNSTSTEAGALPGRWRDYRVEAGSIKSRRPPCPL